MLCNSVQFHTVNKDSEVKANQKYTDRQSSETHKHTPVEPHKHRLSIEMLVCISKHSERCSTNQNTRINVWPIRTLKQLLNQSEHSDDRLANREHSQCHSRINKNTKATAAQPIRTLRMLYDQSKHSDNRSTIQNTLKATWPIKHSNCHSTNQFTWNSTLDQSRHAWPIRMFGTPPDQSEHS